MKSLLNKFYIRINCQKFILLIILIFFYSCENNSSLRLKCVFKSIDEKYLISPTYKIGEEAYFLYELKSKKYIVTEQHIKHYLVSSTRGGYYLSYTELDRYSGVMTQQGTVVPTEEIQDLLNKNIIKEQLANQSNEVFNRIKGLTIKWFFENKLSSKDYTDKFFWYEAKLNCEKSNKKF